MVNSITESPRDFYRIGSRMFDRLGLADPTLNRIAAAMIFLGCGPHQIELELTELPVSVLLEYVQAAEAFGLNPDTIVLKGGINV